MQKQKETVEEKVEVEETLTEEDLKEVVDKYQENGEVPAGQPVKEEEEEEEDRVVVGHKAEAIWEEKNIPRTRKLRNTFHKNEEVAENMALKTIEEYFVNQGKEGIDLEEVEIKLHPIYEEWTYW